MPPHLFKVSSINVLGEIVQKSQTTATITPPHLMESPPLIDIDLIEAFPLFIMLLVGLVILGYLIRSTVLKKKETSKKMAEALPQQLQEQETFLTERDKHQSRSTTAVASTVLSKFSNQRSSKVPHSRQNITVTDLIGAGDSPTQLQSQLSTFNSPIHATSKPEIDPIALDRVMDFHNIILMLIIKSDGSIVHFAVKPGENQFVSIETMARHFSFNPLSLLEGGLYEVKTEYLSQFPCLYVTGKYLRLIFMLKQSEWNNWLVNAMSEALALLETEIEGKIDPQFAFPSTITFDIPLEHHELIYILETWLPISFLHELIMKKDVIDNLERMNEEFPKSYIINWKSLLNRVFMEFSEIDSTLLGFTYEDLPTGLIVPTTFSQLWRLATKDLNLSATEAAETLIIGLTHDIITAKIS